MSALPKLSKTKSHASSNFFILSFTCRHALTEFIKLSARLQIAIKFKRHCKNTINADVNIVNKLSYILCSGVTTRGEVRQLPQGAKRQGALGGAFDRRIVCFALQNSTKFLKRERS